MPVPAFVAPLIISGIGALGQALANRKSKQQQNQQNQFDTNQTQNSNYSNFSATNPILDGPTSALRDQLVQNFMSRGFDFGSEADALTTGRVRQINAGADTTRRGIINTLAQRGLGGGPAEAAALASYESDRVGKVGDAFAESPLVADQLRQNWLQQGTGLFSAMPKGSTSEGFGSSSTDSRNFGTSSGSGTQTNPGNMLGGGISGLAQLLAFFQGRGAFGGGSGGSASSTF